jgi:hypothetical protein
MHGQQRIPAANRAARAGADGAPRSNGNDGLGSRARHQRLLREVNDRIAELAKWNEARVRLFVCECSDRSCADAVEMSAAEYARIRAGESSFVVFPGHERPESERVVDSTGRFVVVASREFEEAQPRVSGAGSDE